MIKQSNVLRFWNKKRFYFSFGIILLSLSFIWVSPVYAQDIVYAGGIPAGSVVDQDVILSASEVVIDGTVNGDVLALGQLVTVNGTINGSLYSGAEILTIGGKVTGSVYSTGGTLRLKPASKLERSAFFAGGLMDFQSGSSISRDLYSLALGGQFNGTISRDMRAIIGPSELFKAFLRVTGIQLPVISLPTAIPAPTATPVSSLYTASLIPLPIPAFIKEPAASFYPNSLPLDLSAFDWASWGKSVLRTMAELLLIGVLLAWLASASLSQAAALGSLHPWIAFFYGLCAVVISLSALVLAFAIMMLLGSFLNWVSLTTLAWITWVGGCAIVITAATLYLFLLAIVSKLVTAYLVGSWLLNKIVPEGKGLPIWSILTGIIIYALLASIPSMGWLIALFATLFGLGAGWLWFRGRISGLRPMPIETI
ncbi:MAG TPA: polymer-forming cytoskeletal protein [Leptolinea sp.]